MVEVNTPVPLGSAHRSLADQVYETLRQRIIEGALPPGSWLRERELADEFNISRIPLREAMPRLEAEGFIITHPRRGAVVRQLTLRDAVEFFDVRSGLEVLAARLAAERVAAGADGRRLREAMAVAQDVTARGAEFEIADANAAIHAEIVRLADNRLLTKAMQPINGLEAWFFGVTSERDQGVQVDEHLALVAAVLDGDASLAAELALSHVEHSRDESLPLLADQLPAE